MKKKKILFVMHELVAGGAERVVINLANNLDREKFDVHLCLFNTKGTLGKLLNDDITIHDLDSTRVMKGALKLPLLFIKQKPDIIFSSIDHVNLLLSLQVKFLKFFLKNTLFVAREVNIPSIRAKYEKTSKKLDKIYRQTISNFDIVIAQSNYMKEDIVKSYRIDDSKVQVVSNPLDIKHIERALFQSKDEVGLLKNNKVNVLAVGFLRPQKGFDLLLEAVSYFDENLHLNILGEGAERTNLEGIIKKLGIQDKVTLLGKDDNPFKYMRSADIVVLSSLYEGFPNVVLEANACGKYVVAFECPGVNNEIIENNVNGCLVELKNIKALAESLNKSSLIAHDELKIKQTTHKYWVENVAMKYEEILL
jgi:glycosyltransferase involved in cell wall biosynthesis